MSTADDELLSAFDGHEVDGVRAALEAGANPCDPIRGKLPIDWLLGEHSRSEQLGDCLRLLIARGANLRDPAITPVLLNDAGAIKAAIIATPSLLRHTTRLVSAFTSLEGVSLLHVAAEFGNVDAVRVLIEAGADVNAKAEVDEYGLNGHTPLFHVVNASHNRSESIMRLLLTAGAHSDIRVAGIHWGKGYEWETTFFDVTPVSYAQMGLLPQVHRSEVDIYSRIKCLLGVSGRDVPPLGNVPNRYLQPKPRG
jgi:ankyrin repeat protein